MRPWSRRDGATKPQVQGGCQATAAALPSLFLPLSGFFGGSPGPPKLCISGRATAAVPDARRSRLSTLPGKSHVGSHMSLPHMHMHMQDAHMRTHDIWCPQVLPGLGPYRPGTVWSFHPLQMPSCKHTHPAPALIFPFDFPPPGKRREDLSVKLSAPKFGLGTRKPSHPLNRDGAPWGSPMGWSRIWLLFIAVQRGTAWRDALLGGSARMMLCGVGQEEPKPTSTAH